MTFPAARWPSHGRSPREIDWQVHVTIQTDNRVKLTASDPGLDKDKINYRFVTNGELLDIAAVKIWQVAE